MKRNNLIRFFVGLTIGFLICLGLYGCCSFAVWDTDPSNWRDEVRGFFAFVSLIIMIFVTAVVTFSPTE